MSFENLDPKKRRAMARRFLISKMTTLLSHPEILFPGSSRKSAQSRLVDISVGNQGGLTGFQPVFAMRCGNFISGWAVVTNKPLQLEFNLNLELLLFDPIIIYASPAIAKTMRCPTGSNILRSKLRLDGRRSLCEKRLL